MKPYLWECCFHAEKTLAEALLTNSQVCVQLLPSRRVIIEVGGMKSPSVDTILFHSMDISFNEGLVNLNWTQIMKTVNDDTISFFAEGNTTL